MIVKKWLIKFVINSVEVSFYNNVSAKNRVRPINLNQLKLQVNVA